MPGHRGFASALLILGIAGAIILVLVAGITVKDKFDQRKYKDQNQGEQRGENKSYVEAPDDAAVMASDELKPKAGAIYITATPVDLSQIEKISRFRSCEAHDYSGLNFLGEVESDRSMKHYFMPKPSFNYSNDKVKVYSPLDGKVTSYRPPDAVYNPGWGRGGFIGITPPSDPNVMVELAHVNVDSSIKLGDELKAGQLIGYAAVPEGNDFDFHVRALDRQNPENYRHIFDSIFNHMSQEVLTDFAKYNLSKEQMLFSKEFRDKNPCGFPPDLPETKPEDYANVKSTPQDWVYLK